MKLQLYRNKEKWEEKLLHISMYLMCALIKYVDSSLLK